MARMEEDLGQPDEGAPVTALTFRAPGGAELAHIETQTEALAAAAAREMEVRYALARRFPREIDQVERRLLADCARPGFATGARYSRPVGKKRDDVTGEWIEQLAEGFSIRYAEAALAALGNMDAAAYTIYEDAEKARVRCVVSDLENNGSWKMDIDVPKTVERRKLKRGQRAISIRENTYGDTVYVVEATPEEFRVKTAAEISKGLRTLILRLVPADVKEACEAQIRATLTDEFRRSASTTVAKITEAFGKLRPPVSAADVGAYLGHTIEEITEAEYLDLRAIYTGIAEGMTTWATLRAEKRGDVEQEAGAKSTVDKLRATLAERAAKKKGSANAIPAADGAKPDAAAQGDAAPQGPAADAKPAGDSPKADPAPAAEQREPGSDG
jgi:hypothetical protein